MPISPSSSSIASRDPAGRTVGEVGQGERYRILSPVEVALRVEDLRGGPGRILIERRQLRPRVALPEGVDEADARGVRKREHGPDVGGRARDDRAADRRPDGALEIGDVRQRGEVAALPAEAQVVREGDGLAFDQRVAGGALVASSGRGAQEPIEVDEPVLEHVDELVGQGVAPQLGRQPVREHHPLRAGIVVRGGLLREEIRQEDGQVEVGGNEAPGDEGAPLGVETRGRVLPRLNSATTNRRRSSVLWITSGGGPPGGGSPRRAARSPRRRVASVLSSGGTRACPETARAMPVMAASERRARGTASRAADGDDRRRRRHAASCVPHRIAPGARASRRRLRAPKRATSQERGHRDPAGHEERRAGEPPADGLADHQGGGEHAEERRRQVERRQPAGPVRLEERHVRDEVESRDDDALVEERGAEAPGEDRGRGFEHPGQEEEQRRPDDDLSEERLDAGECAGAGD